jgi:hypothetical protein
LITEIAEHDQNDHKLLEYTMSITACQWFAAAFFWELGSESAIEHWLGVLKYGIYTITAGLDRATL